MENLPIILAVEDERLIQSVVEEALADAGFEIAIASSAEQAMELLESADGKFRALVTDISLGRDRLNGWDVARRARQIDPAFPVIYMSGGSAEDWASKAFRTASCGPSRSHPPNWLPPFRSLLIAAPRQHKSAGGCSLVVGVNAAWPENGNILLLNELFH